MMWSFVDDGEVYVLPSHPGATPVPFEVHCNGYDPQRYGKQGKVPKIPPIPGPPLSSELKQLIKLRNEETHRHQNVESAEFALAYYNKKHHTDYKLVDALGSAAFLAGHIWHHTSFTAKQASKPHNDDSSPKLFFAELQQVRRWPAPPIVHCCRIVEGTKTKIGCIRCGPYLVHPTGGFIQGRYVKGTRALRPRLCGRNTASTLMSSAASAKLKGIVKNEV